MFLSKKDVELLRQAKSDWEKLAQLYEEKCDILEGLLKKYEELDALKDAQIERLLTMVRIFVYKEMTDDAL